MTEDGTMFEVAEIKKYNLDIKGIYFASKMEAEYYPILKAKLDNGEIDSLTLQPVYVLQDKPRITYKADYEVTHLDGTTETIDVKGKETAAFRVKIKQFMKHF